MTNWDWLIAVSLTSLLVWLVFRSKKYVKDVAGFVVAGRKTRMWLGLSNNNSGGLGLVSIAYGCQEGFRHGFSLTWLSLIGAGIGLVLYGIFGFGIERLRASKAMTGGQFHEMRYSRGLRILVGSVMAIGGIVNQAAFPVVGAMFLRAFLGWPEQFELCGQALPTIPVMAACMIIMAVFFTVVCGQVGVVLTDYFQGLIIMGGLFAITWIIFRRVGIESTQNILREKMGDGAFNPFMSGSYGVLWAVWLFVGAILSPFSSGPVMSKNASADNPKVVRLMMLITTTFGQGKNLLKLTLGVAAFVIIGNLAAPEGMDKSQYEKIVTPMFLNSICPPILMGVLFSAFLFAFISTNDTYLLSWSSILVNDVVCPLRRKPMPLKSHIWSLRLTIVGIGVFLYFWGIYFMYGSKTTILNYLMLTGTMYSGSAIAMIAGLYWKRANTAGAYAAVLTGMIMPLLDLILRKTLGEMYPLSPQQAGLGTIGLSAVLLVIFSLASTKPTKWVDYGKVVRKSESSDHCLRMTQ